VKRAAILLISVLVVISMVLVGCAPEAAPPPEEEEEAAPEEEEEEAPPAAPEEEVFEITWQDTDPPAQSQWYALQNLAERVRAASGGRLDITVFPEGGVVPRNECTPAVKDGVVDIATIPTSIDTGRLGPVTYLLTCSGLPAGPSTIECIAWLYKGGGLEMMNDIYSDWAYVIGASAGAAELFCHSNESLETAADFKGLKFRTFGMWAEVLGGYGAVVTMLPGSELYSGVERGVIDAFEYGPPSTNWAQGFHEICEYVGLPGIQSPGYTKPVLVNKEFFDGLPNDLQALLRHECMNLSLDSYCIVSYEDSLAMQKYADYGTKFFTVEEDFQADIATTTKALCEKYAAEDAAFAEAWDSQNEFFSVWRALTGIFPAYTLYD